MQKVSGQFELVTLQGSDEETVDLGSASQVRVKLEKVDDEINYYYQSGSTWKLVRTETDSELDGGRIELNLAAYDSMTALMQVSFDDFVLECPEVEYDYYACLSLDPNLEDIEVGDKVEFSCEADFSGYEPVAYFRYSSNNGSNWTEEGTTYKLTATNPAKMELTLNDYGTWIVQCRVCTDDSKASCSDWGATGRYGVVAKLVTPSPSPSPSPSIEPSPSATTSSLLLKFPFLEV